MAKFNLEYDTVAKTATITMDGAPVENVGDLCLFANGSSGGKKQYHLEYVQRTQDAGNDTVTYTRTMAHEQALASMGLQEETGVVADILRYFSKD